MSRAVAERKGVGVDGGDLRGVLSPVVSELSEASGPVNNIVSKSASVC
jgi:hypothetical protein